MYLYIYTYLYIHANEDIWTGLSCFKSRRSTASLLRHYIVINIYILLYIIYIYIICGCTSLNNGISEGGPGLHPMALGTHWCADLIIIPGFTTCGNAWLLLWPAMVKPKSLSSCASSCVEVAESQRNTFA